MAEFQLSLFQDGLLPAAFMVGLLISSPIFAEAAKHAGGFRLIGVGLAIWSAATLGSALSPGFMTLVISRMAVGVGEASFVSLAAPFIDDNAPAAAKTRWLATFFLCIPSGYALGFIYGGIVAAALGWRAAFLLESFAMVPFIILCFRAPHVNLRGTHRTAHTTPQEEKPNKLAELADDLTHVLGKPVYCCVCVAMACSTAVLGAYAFYGPQAGRDVFQMHARTVDLAFGGITVATGVFGTLAGGFLLDKVGSSLRNGLVLCAVSLAAGTLFMTAAFGLAKTFAAFCAVFGLGQVALFMAQAPSNALTLWSVPPGLRPLAISLSVVVMHLLGDVPSPPLLGLLQAHLQNWRASMAIMALVLGLGAAAYGLGFLLAKNAVDFRELQETEQAADANNVEEAYGALYHGVSGRESPEAVPSEDDRPLLPVGHHDLTRSKT